MPEVHSMPSRFLSRQKSATGRPRFLVLVVLLLGILVLVGGIVLFLRNTQSRSANENMNAGAANVNAVVSNVNATNANENVNTSTAPTVVTGSLLDALQKPLAIATLTLPSGAISDGSSVTISAFLPTVRVYASDETYQPLAAIYLVAPQGLPLSEEATLSLTYSDADLAKLPFAAKESSLTIAVWESDQWTKKTSVVDQTKNTVSVDLAALPTDAVAIVVPVPESSTNANTNTNALQTVSPSLDSDRDGLTNQEETLYGTDAGEDDTDGDGFLDGSEVRSLYDPNSGKRLSETAFVKLYANTAYRYSILQPVGWALGSLNGDALVTFTTITGEFVQVSVQENSKRESARDWYRALNPSINPSSLKDISVGALTGILGPDGLNVYLADAQSIYQITYNVGVSDEANYLTTFTMMYTSFRTNIAVTNTNVNTNTNTNTNMNTNTNDNSNTNAS